MSSSSESKISFVILIPFLLLVFALAMNAGAPKAPSMPGVHLPVAPTVMAPVTAAPVVAPVETPVTEAAAPAETEAPAEAAENWE